MTERQMKIADAIDRRVNHALVMIRRHAKAAGFRVKLERSRVSESAYVKLARPDMLNTRQIGVSGHSNGRNGDRLLVAVTEYGRFRLLSRSEIDAAAAEMVRAFASCVDKGLIR